jgi:hypothetical protein
MKLMQILNQIENNWIRRVAQANHEVTSLLMRKEEP